MRRGLSPAATKSAAALWGPTPDAARSAGLVCAQRRTDSRCRVRLLLCRGFGIGVPGAAASSWHRLWWSALRRDANGHRPLPVGGEYPVCLGIAAIDGGPGSVVRQLGCAV